MTLIPKRVEEFADFVSLLPEAVKAFDGSYTRWNRDLTNQQLTTDLVNAFKPDNEFYCDQSDDGTILYFFAIIKIGEHRADFWVIYVHPSMRDHTKGLLDWLSLRYKEKGFDTVEFTTTRLTRSYKRWAEKFNARPYALTYKIHLNEQ